jgi:D-alanine-D-alanine ligase-like ATP-grasp enzyme
VDNGVFENVFAGQELIEKILMYDEVIVQKFIQKQREFTVSII